MRKILPIIMSVLPLTAIAAPGYLQKDSDGGYRVTYDYRDKEKNGWYMTFRAELSLLSWDNKYTASDNESAGGDDYSMEPVFGGSLSVGKKFRNNWRGEIEAGYIGSFTDKDAGFETGLTMPYATANAMYDFTNGIYLGGGIGAAMVQMTLDGENDFASFVPGDRAKTNMSPMGALMVGFSHKLDDNFVFDVRYRLSGIMGAKQSRTLNAYDNLGNFTGQVSFENKIDFILDNSISAGIRYEF